MKPERAWKVGDQTFDTYEEARAYATANKAALEYDELVKAIEEAVEQCPYGQASEGSGHSLADYLLERFTIKPKKKGPASR
jgi:hypothetical protein